MLLSYINLCLSFFIENVHKYKWISLSSIFCEGVITSNYQSPASDLLCYWTYRFIESFQKHMGIRSVKFNTWVIIYHAIYLLCKRIIKIDLFSIIRFFDIECARGTKRKLFRINLNNLRQYLCISFYFHSGWLFKWMVYLNSLEDHFLEQ